MLKANMPLSDSSHTGFAGGQVTSKAPTIICTAVMGLCLSGTIGTGAVQINQLNQYDLPGQNEIVMSEAGWRQATRQMLSAQIISVNVRLKQLKDCLGLNILELAAILHVSRPTIYKWIETEDINVRQTNHERLNRLYEIGKAWKAKKLGPLGSYLYKSFGQSSTSLFSLLKSNRLSTSEIDRYLNDIAQLMIVKRRKNEEREALLKKHSFEPVSKDDMEDRLNDIDFMD